jgi:thiol-disulfide isomerase/thioredoxin
MLRGMDFRSAYRAVFVIVFGLTLPALSGSGPDRLARAEAPPARKAPAAKGWFGIGLKAATPAELKTMNETGEVPRIERVFRKSPAETAGIQVGDFVLKFQSKKVAGVADLVKRVGATPPGTQVEFEIFRPGKGRIIKPVVLDLRVDMRARFKQEWLGSKMPSVGITGVRRSDGDRVDLSPTATAGLVVVIDYFATWCGPCKAVMPQLEALQKQYESDGVRVVGVSGEDMDVVKPFIAKRPLAYRVGIDATGEFRKHLAVSVLPTVWVVDRKGIIRDIFFGAGHHAAIEASVRRAAGLPSKRTK